MTLVLSVLTLSTSAAAQEAGNDPITGFLDAFADWALPILMMLLFLGAVITAGLSRGPFGPEWKNRFLNSAKACLIGLIAVPLLVLTIPVILDMIPMDTGDINPFATLVSYGAI